MRSWRWDSWEVGWPKVERMVWEGCQSSCFFGMKAGKTLAGKWFGCDCALGWEKRKRYLGVNLGRKKAVLLLAWIIDPLSFRFFLSLWFSGFDWSSKVIRGAVCIVDWDIGWASLSHPNWEDSQAKAVEDSNDDVECLELITKIH